jgi:hypothetical protein
MSKRKRIDASTMDQVIDASELMTITVRLEHCRHAVPGDPELCALVIAAKSQHGFDGFVVHRTVAYARRKSASKWMRYQSSATTRRFVEAFDRGDFTGITNGGITFEFKPPRKAISLATLRSPRKRKMRQASYERRQGEPRRPYRLPDPKTISGVRNRFGYRA